MVFLLLQLQLLLFEELVATGIEDLAEESVQNGLDLIVEREQVRVMLFYLSRVVHSRFGGIEQPLHWPVQIKVRLALLRLFAGSVSQLLNEGVGLDREMLAILNCARRGRLQT